MSLDTAFARSSSMLDPGQIPYPPNGVIDASDRAFMLEFYTSASPYPDVGVGSPSWAVTVPATPTMAVVVVASASFAVSVPDHDDAIAVIVR